MKTTTFLARFAPAEHGHETNEAEAQHARHARIRDVHALTARLRAELGVIRSNDGEAQVFVGSREGRTTAVVLVVTQVELRGTGPAS